MDRAWKSGASATPPTAPSSPSMGHPTAGNPGLGVPATKPGEYWYHAVTEELRAVVVAGGLAPDHDTLNQVALAIQAMIAAASSGAAVTGAFRNLKASATGLGGNVSVSADELIVSSAGGSYHTLIGVALAAINGAAVGANGLDAGALATSTWYSLWVIWNGVTTAGLLSLSATAPTLPAGYTHKARVGWILTDGTGNKYPCGFTQRGRSVQYLVSAAGNLQAIPIMAAGLAGNVNTPTWISVSTSGFVPVTASQIYLALRGGNTGSVICAPNSSYGGPNSTTNPAPGSYTVSATTYGAVQRLDMLLESASVFWASDLASNLLACVGWEDNL